jgi:hypothetical protein
MQLIIDLPEAQLASALGAAFDRKMAFSDFVLDAIAKALPDDDGEDGPITVSTDILDELVTLSVEKARLVPSGEEFLLFDVCPRNSWLALSSGDRKQLGKRFRKAVEGGGLAVWVRRRSDNHAIYRRT